MADRMEGHTALITGANSGIGLELTKQLLGAGWEVISLIRSALPADEPLVAQAQAAGRLRIYQADLSDYHSLKHALASITTHETRIDVLFNNAAAAVGGIQQSPQGREVHFEVNTVVPYIITRALQPLVAQSALKTIVNTSSNALLFVRQFDLGLLMRPQVYQPLWGPYGASKLGLSLWTQALAPALQAEGIEIRSVDPGANKTKMTGSAAMPAWLLPIRNLFFAHPRRGAAQIYAAAGGRWRGTTGVFVHRGKATPLPFQQHGPAVLETIQSIYEQAFPIAVQ